MVPATLLIGLIASGVWLKASEPTASAKFCTADAGIGIDGETYGRSLEHDCAFVDERGDPALLRDPDQVQREADYTEVLNRDARATFGGLVLESGEIVIWSTEPPASVEALLEANGLEVPPDAVTIRQGVRTYDDLVALAGTIEALARDGTLPGAAVVGASPDVATNGVQVAATRAISIEELQMAMPRPDVAAAITSVSVNQTARRSA